MECLWVVDVDTLGGIERRIAAAASEIEKVTIGRGDEAVLKFARL